MNVFVQDMITIFAVVLLFFTLFYVEFEFPDSYLVRVFIEHFKKKCESTHGMCEPTHGMCEPAHGMCKSERPCAL